MKPFLARRLFSSLIVLSLAYSVVAIPVSQRHPSDDLITDQVRIKLADDPVVKGGSLIVSVEQGVVTLAGSVETSKQRSRAEQVARKVKGVKQVVNHIEIKHR